MLCNVPGSECRGRSADQETGAPHEAKKPKEGSPEGVEADDADVKKAKLQKQPGGRPKKSLQPKPEELEAKTRKVTDRPASKDGPKAESESKGRPRKSVQAVPKTLKEEKVRIKVLRTGVMGLGLLLKGPLPRQVASCQCFGSCHHVVPAVIVQNSSTLSPCTYHLSVLPLEIPSTSVD